MNTKHYTYRVTWSHEDGEHVGMRAELPSLSWLAKTPEAALKGIQKVASDVVTDMLASGEAVPVALAEKNYSGEFRAVSYTHLRAHETRHDLVCRLLLEK